ncbi:hypothetical protein C8F04DRAFT_1258622 [Mycena alexandri]|uniref:Uncharacterized protein n=1 Tax=Mycena alexandri TaxID=1745969 RepID=A0AAD6SZ65_9AGAR|nr:hypothetical protein C8F04DRAFT_1258622 [Mycena alexandri]
MALHHERNRRGYDPKDPQCEGRLLLRYDYQQQPYIKCEHYSKHNIKDHYLNMLVSDGSYDVAYLEALFGDHEDKISEIEEAAIGLGYGPLVECTTVCNISSQKSLCPFDHRNDEGVLMQLEMMTIKCACHVKVYVPFPEYRAACPKVLAVAKGVHPHSIPLPTKTPPAIKHEILDLLPRFQEDLPDLTPRRFLRSPIVKLYLAVKFPRILNPTMSDLHISLANRSHLKAYINQVRKSVYPHGTEWRGNWPLTMYEVS